MTRRRSVTASGIFALALGGGALATDAALVRATKWATEATWQSDWLARLGGSAEAVGSVLETAYHLGLLAAGVALLALVAIACGYTTARRMARPTARLADAGAALAALGLLWILLHL
jgi:hypothetical protein